MRANGKAMDPLATSRLRVGGAIRQKRHAAGLSLAELAGRVGVALSTMSKIENGRISTSFERLESIGTALAADVTELIGAAPAALDARLAAPRPAYGTRRSITRAATTTVPNFFPPASACSAALNAGKSLRAYSIGVIDFPLVRSGKREPHAAPAPALSL